MDRPTLDLFCRQLAHWAEGAIESGRSPFRRAETFFPLLTAVGKISPPLLLWINRDSYMAGGILLFPPRRSEESVAEGRACAQALGLRHFVTWAPKEVVIWEETGGNAVRHKVMPTAEADSPESFCAIFRTLLEELKPLAVIGAVPATELSPFYLANLCQHARRATSPLLGEAFRVAKSERRPTDSAIPAAAALQQTHLTLLRLLALSIEDRLPPISEPEGLDRVLRFALDSLPPTLRKPLECCPWEIPLPPAMAVRLHNLLRRLTQLRFAENRLRCRQALEILLRTAAAELGGGPLPPRPEDAPAATLLLNSDGCYPETEIVAEIASPALLAFNALLRHLGREVTVLQLAHPLALDKLPSPVLILGHLPASAPPAASERRLLAARLRLAWPNRRFPLSVETPRWIFEILHLLGLAGEGSRLVLDLPDFWLTAPSGAILHTLLREQFALAGLRRLPGRVRLDLHRGTESIETTFLVGAAGERQISWARLRQEPNAFLPLALDLTEPIFLLLMDGTLRVLSDWPEGVDDGIFLFSRSSLGRFMWQLVSNGRHLPRRISLVSQLQRHGFPLPTEEILHQLQGIHTAARQGTATSLIDRELGLWLGSDLTTFAIDYAGNARTGRKSFAENEELLDQIRRTVFVDGLPRFPEHFLYEYYRPQLIEYRFSGPLTAGEEFFDQQKLFDQEGKELLVEGSETARALLLASFAADNSVALPADRQLTTKILGQYLDRLRSLRQELNRECHRRLPDVHLAEAVVDKIWNDLPLPPWTLIADGIM